MTRHERCMAAIRGEQVDRAPRYITGISCEVASKILGRDVHTGTGSLIYAELLSIMQGESAHEEFVEKLFEDLAELNRVLDVDVYRMPWRDTRKPALRIDEYTFLFGDPDGAHSVTRYLPESGDYGTIKSVVSSRAEVPGPGEAETGAVSSGDFQLDADYLRICERYGDEFFVLCNGGIVCAGRDEDDLVMLIEDPERVKLKVRAQAEQALALAKALAGTPYPRVLVAGGDMAGNEGPIYSPAIFREVMLPSLKYLMGELEKCGVHYMFRSDGNLWPVADMLFKEAGCPGYGEVDRDVGMTVKALRERYPDLVIWNNISCGKLQLESVEWIREDSRRCIEESGGTRYFHGASNAILKGTPVENVEAMFSV